MCRACASHSRIVPALTDVPLSHAMYLDVITNPRQAACRYSVSVQWHPMRTSTGDAHTRGRTR
jgi:hypothetical protein